MDFHAFFCWGGRKMGLEPTTLGTTIRCSNRLSYKLHVWANGRFSGMKHGILCKNAAQR